MTIKIAVIEKYSRFLDALKKEVPKDCEFFHIPSIKEINEKTVHMLRETDIIFGSKITKDIIINAKKLKLIQLFGAGVKKEFLELFRELKNFKNIKVANTHGNKEAVAEHAIALLLALTKNLVRYDKVFREGKWALPNNEYNTFLAGKTAGIIGLGNVGREIAKRLKAFNIRIIAIKRTKDDTLREKLGIAFLGDAKDLDYILKNSDFVFISVPRTYETKKLITREKLELLKPNAFLINISRGDVIDEEALYKILKEHRIKGAGLDVWYEYPKDPLTEIKYPSKYPFHELENVVMTPHVAWKTPESERLQLLQVAENIKRISNGEEPINLVNIELGY